MMTRWQVFGAIALRQLPELRPRLDPIEVRVQQIFSAYEVARSRYSDHEIQHLEDIRKKEDSENEVVIKETAQDREDIWVKEKSEFTFGAYDESLTKTKYLFINTKFGTDIQDQWILPQTVFDKNKDNNLLDTARRALREQLKVINGYRIVSKVPSSCCSFKYSKKISELTGFDGAQVFFLKAHLDSPDQTVLAAIDSTKNDKLRWGTRDDAEKFVRKRYFKSLSQGLLNEDRVDVKKVLARAVEYAHAGRKLQQRESMN